MDHTDHLTTHPDHCSAFTELRVTFFWMTDHVLRVRRLLRIALPLVLLTVFLQRPSFRSRRRSPRVGLSILSHMSLTAHWMSRRSKARFSVPYWLASWLFKRSRSSSLLLSTLLILSWCLRRLRLLQIQRLHDELSKLLI